MSRIPEVFDCWFESGSMPYAQQHYPFENKEYFEKHFPADFISEGLDQTRGWFYTLTVLAAHLFDAPAFKNCIVNGLVLAEDGRKMSKSLKNYTDPIDAINKADDLKYSDAGVREILKNILIPLWSGYGFFITYANIDGYTATGEVFAGKKPQNLLDAWIVSVAQKMVKDVSTSLDDYDLSGAIDPLVNFIDQLNNWYIRRSRRRFWRSENDTDKKEAYESLYYALKIFALCSAPFIPFISEEIWQNLRTESDAQSVHLADFPKYNENLRDEKIEFRMASVQKAVSMGRSLRNQFNLKNRQPLASLQIVTRKSEERAVLQEMEDTIAEELNVKSVVFHEREDELVEYSAKANFKTLGKILGAKMKNAASKIASLDGEKISKIVLGEKIPLDVDGTQIELDSEKVIVERKEKAGLRVVNEGTLTVALDTRITDDLKREGHVRDLVRAIQNLRKESGFSVTDRISLKVGGDADLKVAFVQFKDFISGETLAVNAEWDDSISGAEIESEDKKWRAAVAKA